MSFILYRYQASLWGKADYWPTMRRLYLWSLLLWVVLFCGFVWAAIAGHLWALAFVILALAGIFYDVSGFSTATKVLMSRRVPYDIQEQDP